MTDYDRNELKQILSHLVRLQTQAQQAASNFESILWANVSDSDGTLSDLIEALNGLYVSDDLVDDRADHLRTQLELAD